MALAEIRQKASLRSKAQFKSISKECRSNDLN